jgi:hypothetical protein
LALGQCKIYFFLVFKAIKTINFDYNNKMVFRNLQVMLAKLALFALLFATLAPTVSHAIALQSGQPNFNQSICSVAGQKLIKVVTTQGQQLQTVLTIKPSSTPSSLDSHLTHCPFCHAGVTDAVMPFNNPAFVLYLQTHQALQMHTYASPFVPVVSFHVPLTRGPPVYA